MILIEEIINTQGVLKPSGVIVAEGVSHPWFIKRLKALGYSEPDRINAVCFMPGHAANWHVDGPRLSLLWYPYDHPTPLQTLTQTIDTKAGRIVALDPRRSHRIGPVDTPRYVWVAQYD